MSHFPAVCTLRRYTLVYASNAFFALVRQITKDSLNIIMFLNILSCSQKNKTTLLTPPDCALTLQSAHQIFVTSRHAQGRKTEDKLKNYQILIHNHYNHFDLPLVSPQFDCIQQLGLSICIRRWIIWKSIIEFYLITPDQGQLQEKSIGVFLMRPTMG